MDALKLIQGYRNAKFKYYPIKEQIPLDGLISEQEQKNIIENDEHNIKCILRKDYECAVFRVLRVKLRHKEIWIKNSYKYRDPEEDTPKDFDERQEEYFALVDPPLSGKIFIDRLRQELCEQVIELDHNFPKNDLVKIVKRKGKPWISLTPLQKIEEPKIVQRIKEAILDNWGIIDLLDVVKEVDLRENFTNYFTTAGNRKILDQENIRKRLFLFVLQS